MPRTFFLSTFCGSPGAIEIHLSPAKQSDRILKVPFVRKGILLQGRNRIL